MCEVGRLKMGTVMTECLDHSFTDSDMCANLVAADDMPILSAALQSRI